MIFWTMCKRFFAIATGLCVLGAAFSVTSSPLGALAFGMLAGLCGTIAVLLPGGKDV